MANVTTTNYLDLLPPELWVEICRHVVDDDVASCLSPDDALQHIESMWTGPYLAESPWLFDPEYHSRDKRFIFSTFNLMATSRFFKPVLSKLFWATMPFGFWLPSSNRIWSNNFFPNLYSDRVNFNLCPTPFPQRRACWHLIMVALEKFMCDEEEGVPVMYALMDKPFLVPVPFNGKAWQSIQKLLALGSSAASLWLSFGLAVPVEEIEALGMDQLEIPFTKTAHLIFNFETLIMSSLHRLRSLTLWFEAASSPWTYTLHNPSSNTYHVETTFCMALKDWDNAGLTLVAAFPHMKHLRIERSFSNVLPEWGVARLTDENTGSISGYCVPEYQLAAHTCLVNDHIDDATFEQVKERLTGIDEHVNQIIAKLLADPARGRKNGVYKNEKWADDHGSLLVKPGVHDYPHPPYLGA